jgi:hypothetical protein
MLHQRLGVSARRRRTGTMGGGFRDTSGRLCIARWPVRVFSCLKNDWNQLVAKPLSARDGKHKQRAAKRRVLREFAVAADRAQPFRGLLKACCHANASPSADARIDAY